MKVIALREPMDKTVPNGVNVRMVLIVTLKAASASANPAGRDSNVRDRVR